jgi:hypothetical protein
LDVAYILVWRERHASKKFVYYWMADSSPVVGYEWLNTSCTYVAESDLCSILRAVRELVDPGLAEESVKARTRFLCESVQDHQLIPVVLGKGACSLDAKMAGIMWALWLETGSANLLTEVCGRTRSWTTDMGTEVGLNDYNSVSLMGLLRPPLAPDDLEADVGVVPDPIVVDDLIPDDGGHGNVAPPPDPLESTQGFVFGQSLGCAGMLHILHNALGDAGRASQLWGEMEPRIRIVSRFFANKGCRERFVKFCCVDDNAHLSFLFTEKPPEFIAWRWGSLMDWCSWFNARCLAIWRCWKRALWDKSTDADGREEDSYGSSRNSF